MVSKVMKRCSKCGLDKSTDSYGKNSASADGLRPNCNDCRRIQRRAEYVANPGRFRRAAIAWGERNPEKKSAAGKRWYSENKERHKATGKAWMAIESNRRMAVVSTFEGGLKRKYNINPDDYYAKLSAQNSKCAIPSCKNTTRPDRALSVDHNHSTGAVRGLLCSNCNAALGLVDDKIEMLIDLIDYLNMHDGTSHGGFVASIYTGNQLN